MNAKPMNATTAKHHEPTVFIVDDEKTMHEYIRGVAESIELKVASFYAAQEFLDVYTPDQPGCVLLDIRMPGMSGLELHKRLIARDFKIPVIMMTAHGDVSIAVEAMKSGAFDFIEKPFKMQALLDRLQQAIKADEQNRIRHAEREEVLQNLQQLTKRERDIMEMLVRGKVNKVIATELNISYKTVENHRASIIKKMQVTNIVELVQVALIGGILSEDERNAQLPNS